MDNVKFNTKAVVLGFLHLTSIPILHKAMHMFSFLSQLRPIIRQGLFSPKVKEKAELTISK